MPVGIIQTGTGSSRKLTRYSNTGSNLGSSTLQSSSTLTDRYITNGNINGVGYFLIYQTSTQFDNPTAKIVLRKLSDGSIPSVTTTSFNVMFRTGAFGISTGPRGTGQNLYIGWKSTTSTPVWSIDAYKITEGGGIATTTPGTTRVLSRTGTTDLHGLHVDHDDILCTEQSAEGPWIRSWDTTSSPRARQSSRDKFLGESVPTPNDLAADDDVILVFTDNYTYAYTR